MCGIESKEHFSCSWSLFNYSHSVGREDSHINDRRPERLFPRHAEPTRFQHRLGLSQSWQWDRAHR